ncbi:Chaperone SurA (Peptidyl-prolyl cis-trans isomerase SurA) (PPIase SurA) (Rotamase SurA) [Durusdinium trenchii]|uniref:Chaperone SurA (Peptidyl-prolyl cis-trans isomerase SurA) (PPIase SurA) (Rotamase SurA) n=1 Tax=Durusdinium trenchii TaxID=1381693 RepID=A0ABP0LS50_9DINO
MRSAGLSVWRLLGPAGLIAAIAGLLIITVFDPLASNLLSYAEQVKTKNEGSESSLVRVFDDGIWLRQRDPTQQIIINAQNFNDEKAALEKVTVWRFGQQSVFLERIDATEAYLSGKTMELHEARLKSITDQEERRTPIYAIKTALTSGDLRERVAPPETMSLWQLPRFILLAEAAGLPTVRYHIRFHDLCATPLKLLAMVLIAAAFSLRPMRMGGALGLLIFSIGAGFILYMLSEISTAFGESGLVPVALAAWAPALIATLAAAEPEEVLFEADTVTREFDDGPIVAEGNVRAFFGERYLRADRLIYNPASDIVIAEGNVSITDEDLETAFAGRVELSGDLRDGVADNFSALLEDNARLAAENAVQEQGARTRLNRAVYTACNVCKDNGRKKTPTWRMKALRVTRDKERKVIRFKHTFFELKGVPILYMPFVQAPDPSVERQSGFLPPRIGASSRLGFNLEVPYYLAISNSQDATFFPRFTANDGTLWQGEYRRRGKRGYHVLSGGIIDSTNAPEPPPPAPGAPFIESTPGVRWHYFGKGFRDFGESWRVSYDFERASDDDYLRQFDIIRRGDLRQELDRSNTNQLRSNARVAWRRGANNLTFDTFLFQGLRAQDDASTIPHVLPLINYQRRLQSRVAGGNVSVGANIASLYRTGGTDSQRFTASAFWDRDVITNSGHRFKLFAEARGDAYFFQDLDQGTEILPGVPGDPTQFEARFAPSAGVEWSYPLARNTGGARFVIEPRVQIVASPTGVNRSEIINEDSQSIEFDYAGLFDFNKSTGFDAFEDGQRLNVGLAGSAVWDHGLSIDASVGQQFRIQDTSAFDPSSGLGETKSDIVGSFNLRYKNLFGLENRFRIDDNLGDIPRAESRVFFNVGPLSNSATYVRLNEENDQSASDAVIEQSGVPRESVAAVVNDAVITTFDLRQRMRLMLASAGGQVPIEALPQLQRQALKDLVEEKLKLQEAAEFELEITNDELKQEFDLVAAKSNMTPEDFIEALREDGISALSLQEQIEAGIVWPQLVQGRYRDRIRVSEDEVEDTLERMREDISLEQFLVSEICIPVADPSQAQQYYQGSLQLIEQMRAGVPFSVVAQQFSACTTAAVGGDVGWVRAGELPTELDTAIRELPPGAVTNPIPSEGAFMILAVRDRREAAVAGEPTFKLAYAGAVERIGENTARLAFEKLATADACSDRAMRLDLGEGIGVSLLENVTLGDVDERFRDFIEDLERGDTSAVIKADGAYHVAYVCDKDEGLGLPSRETLEDRIYSRQLTRIGQQYLRDIERRSMVDIRQTELISLGG